jgi:Ca2+/Na+ antiporter
MQNVSRRILIEFSWLTLSFSLAFLLAIILFGWAFLKGELSSWLPLTSLFFAVTFIVYLIKAFKKKPAITLPG